MEKSKRQKDFKIDGRILIRKDISDIPRILDVSYFISGFIMFRGIRVGPPSVTPVRPPRKVIPRPKTCGQAHTEYVPAQKFNDSLTLAVVMCVGSSKKTCSIKEETLNQGHRGSRENLDFVSKRRRLSRTTSFLDVEETSCRRVHTGCS